MYKNNNMKLEEKNKKREGFRGERAIVTPYSIRSFQAQNEFTKGLYVTHVGYYPCARNHFKERPRGTPENVLIFCDEGKGSITIEKEVYTLTKNRLLVIPANTPHSYMADKQYPWSIFWFHFTGENVHLYSSIIGKLLIEENRLGDREILFEEIYQTLEMGYSPENLEYVSSCLQYLLASFKYSNQYAKIKDLTKTDAIEKSILYMKDNLNNRITLDDIAKYVNYSSSYFGALFTEKTSFSPIDYFNQLKIQKACSLLQFSDMKIKEIANLLGYYDQFHFSKSFKQEMELSPQIYRKRYHQTGKESEI